MKGCVYTCVYLYKWVLVGSLCICECEGVCESEHDESDEKLATEQLLISGKMDVRMDASTIETPVHPTGSGNTTTSVVG